MLYTAILSLNINRLFLETDMVMLLMLTHSRFTFLALSSDENTCLLYRKTDLCVRIPEFGSKEVLMDLY